jgi:hypothetical protein
MRSLAIIAAMLSPIAFLFPLSELLFLAFVLTLAVAAIWFLFL